MKVLYFLTNFPFYSETFISAEIEQLIDSGHTPVVCNFTFAHKNQEGSKVRILNNTKNGAKLLSAILQNIKNGQSMIGLSSFWRSVMSCILQNPKYTLKYIFMLLSADYMMIRAKAENADLAVNHFLFKSTLAGSAICQRIDLQYHLRLHTKRYLYNERILLDILYRAKDITAIADDVQMFYTEKLNGSKKIGVVRQSVNVASLLNIESTDSNSQFFNIIAIGRLIEKKGFDQLIEAYSALQEDVQTKCTLSIYGDGPQHSNLQSLIDANNLNDTIRLLGQADHTELMRSLHNADLLVVPSIELKDDIDGIPTVIIEAMLLKTPVLAYDTASIKEMVLPDKTGFLVKANDKQGLAQQIEKMVEDKALLSRYVDNAFLHAKKEYGYTLAKELTGGTNE